MSAPAPRGGDPLATIPGALGAGARPDKIIVEYKVIDPDTKDIVYERDRFEFDNEAGQPFDRVARDDIS